MSNPNSSMNSYMQAAMNFKALNPGLGLRNSIGNQTYLAPDEEQGYRSWADGLAASNPNFAEAVFNNKGQAYGQGRDYDYRAAYMNNRNLGMDATDGMFHLNDVGKLPNHETFSNESLYAKAYPQQAGQWTYPLSDNGSAYYSNAAKKTYLKKF